MKKQFSFVCIFSSLFLSGCGHNVAKLQRYDPYAQYAPGQAVVIVKINNMNYLDLSRVDRITPSQQMQDPIDIAEKTDNLDPTQMQSGYRKLDLRNAFKTAHGHKLKPIIANEYRILKAKRWVLPYTYAESMYTIEPGVYYISYISAERDGQFFYTGKPGITAQKTITYGAFDVKPGDVLYLGDIECEWRHTHQIKKINIQNNIIQVKKDLQSAGLEQLAQLVQTAQFYKTGSKLSLNDQGKSTLIALQ